MDGAAVDSSSRGAAAPRATSFGEIAEDVSYRTLFRERLSLAEKSPKEIVMLNLIQHLHSTSTACKQEIPHRGAE
jgi:hypothetical protein